MTMPKRPHTRRIFKWTGLGVCGVILGTGLFSMWYGVAYDGEVPPVLGEPIYNVLSLGGHLHIERCVFSQADPTIGSNMLPYLVTPTPSDLRLFSAAGMIPSWAAFDLPDLQSDDDPKIRMGDIVYIRQRWLRCSVPLWLMFVSLAIPTSILWYRDRHRPGPGHCQACGYNLTGNVSGVCSECGTVVESPSGAETSAGGPARQAPLSDGVNKT